MPDPLTLGLAAGGVSTGLQLLGGLGQRDRFNQLREQINRQFDLRLRREQSRAARGTSRRLASAGLGGSGVINQVIEDLQSNLAGQFESQRQQALGQIDLLEAQQPSQLDIIASSIGGGLQTGLNVFGLAGGFDQLLQQPGAVLGGDVNIPGGTNVPGLQFTPGASFATTEQQQQFVTNNPINFQDINNILF